MTSRVPSPVATPLRRSQHPRLDPPRPASPPSPSRALGTLASQPILPSSSLGSSSATPASSPLDTDFLPSSRAGLFPPGTPLLQRVTAPSSPGFPLAKARSLPARPTPPLAPSLVAGRNPSVTPAPLSPDSPSSSASPTLPPLPLSLPWSASIAPLSGGVSSPFSPTSPRSVKNLPSQSSFSTADIPSDVPVSLSLDTSPSLLFPSQVRSPSSPSYHMSRLSADPRTPPPASPAVLPAQSTPSSLPSAHALSASQFHSRGFPSLRDRMLFYDSIVPEMQPTLDNIPALELLLASHPPSPGAFFPANPILCAHSLQVAGGLFSVRPSAAVPGELGLFMDSPLPGYPSPQPLGCYTGWTHAFEDGDQGCPPFTSPTFDMYCLDIGQLLQPSIPLLPWPSASSFFPTALQTSSSGTPAVISCPLGKVAWSS